MGKKERAKGQGSSIQREGGGAKYMGLTLGGRRCASNDSLMRRYDPGIACVIDRVEWGGIRSRPVKLCCPVGYGARRAGPDTYRYKVRTQYRSIDRRERRQATAGQPGKARGSRIIHCSCQLGFIGVTCWGRGAANFVILWSSKGRKALGAKSRRHAEAAGNSLQRQSDKEGGDKATERGSRGAPAPLDTLTESITPYH